ncbi:MAG: bifunctional hydroxymethylpyrimidine kinase/phosphomethylpyrimidine kinase [Methanotrichaceae archaeon]
MPKVVLTIGGSDSGGGAGIQADIKTFSALGLHGTSVITAVTAQNTLGVQRVIGLEPEAVSIQLRSVTDDFHIDFAKTGMLYSSGIVTAVANHLLETKIPLVLDPVIEAEAGGRLLRTSALEAVKEYLIPLAYVVTPNIFEARALTGIPVRDACDAEIAAHKILDLGANAVMIKGGHLDCTDFLLEDMELHQIHGKRAEGGNHGVGCTYSAALTSFLARGYTLRKAAIEAKSFAAQAISNSMDVGRGVAPVSQTGALLKDAYRFRILSDIRMAIEMLEKGNIKHIIPKTGSSIAAALPDAASPEDIAEGKITQKGGEGVHQSGCIKFGEDSPLSRIILAIKGFDQNARAAMILNRDAVSSDQELIGAQAQKIANVITTKDIDLRALEPALLKNNTEGTAMISEIWSKLDRMRFSILAGATAIDVAATAVMLAKASRPN